jgi:hypothetical protein
MKWTAFSFAALLLASLLLPSRVAAQGATTQNGAAAEAKSENAAPVPVRVSGVLHTAKGVPVPGAPVRLLHLPTGKAWMITTDENGNFNVPDLPPGRYRIEARHLGLGSVSQEMELTNDSAPPFELTLHVGATAPKVELAPKAEKTEKAAETPSQAEPAKPASEAAESTSRPQGAKHSHRPKQATENAQPKAPEANTPQIQEKPQISEKTAKDKVQVETAGASSRKKQKAGFQQVEVTGLPTAAADPTQAPDTLPSAETAPLGEASSSDSYLLNGGVARTAPANAAVNFAGANPNGPGQGAVGQAFGEEDSSGGKSPGKGKGKQSKKNKGNAGQVDNLGGGLEALSAREQLKYLKSNRVHIALYDFYGNSVGDSAAYSITDPNPRKLGYYRERFGAKAGGPLVIPHVYDGKDRTFFFANYELQRRRSPFTATDTVPTPDERRGDFTARGVQLYDPFSNLNGPRSSWGTTIPSSRLDQTALAFLRLIPLPNLPGLVNNFITQATQAQAVDRVDALVLHTLSPRFSLQVSYNLLEARSQVSNALPALGNDDSARDQNATVGLTQNWTAHLLNDTRLNFNRSRVESVNRFAFREDLAGELGVTGVSKAPIDWGPPRISFTNYTMMDDGAPTKHRNQTFRLMDNLSYSFSRHTLRVGGEIRRRQKNEFVNSTPRGEFTFSALMTSQLDAQGQVVDNTGWDLADFLIGLPETSTLAFGSESIYLRNWWYVAYFQDDWRIHPRFSINWGVRYELVTPYVERYNRISNLDLNKNITALGVVVPGQVAPFSGSLPQSLLRADTSNWAPRLGIAWRPLRRGGPVVRAGYGIFYNGSIYDQIYFSMIHQPPFAQATTRVTSATQLLTLRNGFPPQPPEVVPNVVAVDPNYEVGYAQIWNLAVETPILSNLLMEMSYTGTKGTHLDLLRAPNQARPGPIIGADQRRRIPGAPDFTYETSGADSIYHGLQVRLQRRMAHGLRFQFLYTYSKSIDNASTIGLTRAGASTGLVQDDANFAAERGSSSFDMRHQFRAWYRYELPFGERRQWLRSGWASSVFGNWTLSGNTTIQSGMHFTAHISTAQVNGIGSFFSQRPDQIGDPNNVPDGQRSSIHIFNTSAFALPPVDRFGNAGRNTIVGPGLMSVNVSLGRRMHFGKDDRYRLDFRWEVANLFNHVSFLGLDSLLGAATFGRVAGGGRAVRTMDLVMRVNF